jgi:hypothetical protein
MCYMQVLLGLAYWSGRSKKIKKHAEKKNKSEVVQTKGQCS